MVLVVNIALGAINGAALVVGGYIKGESIDKFDYQKFAQTVLVGAAVGVIMAYYSVDYVSQ